ncbi:KDEL motif-containing protein 1, partial [Eumeta japonica]
MIQYRSCYCSGGSKIRNPDADGKEVDTDELASAGATGCTEVLVEVAADAPKPNVVVPALPNPKDVLPVAVDVAGTGATLAVAGAVEPKLNPNGFIPASPPPVAPKVKPLDFVVEDCAEVAVAVGVPKENPPVDGALPPESTLGMMERVTLDMLSVQRSKYPWSEKIDKLFWRGRDSRRERLDLISLSRKRPDLIDAAITNFFFFRDEENKYGPKVDHISFLDFFK